MKAIPKKFIPILVLFAAWVLVAAVVRGFKARATRKDDELFAGEYAKGPWLYVWREIRNVLDFDFIHNV